MEKSLEHIENAEHSANDANEKNTCRKEEHILACISAAPSNARIIQTAAKMSEAFQSRFTALFIETPVFSMASQEEKARLREYFKMAERLGATVETVYGEDVPYQIAEFSRISGVTKVVLGRSTGSKRHFWKKPPLTDQLLSYAPDLDIHIIPDSRSDDRYHPKAFVRHDPKEISLNVLKSIAVLAGATGLSFLFYHLGFTEPNIIMVYIVGMLLISTITTHRIYSLVSSVSSVLIFNYLFTKPRFSLSAYGTGYPVTFLVMFLTAYITGTLALRYREQAGLSAKVAYRTQVLLDTDQLLSKAKDREAIFATAGSQIMKLLQRNIMIYENQGGEIAKSYQFLFSEKNKYKALENGKPQEEGDTEETIVKWVLLNNRAAGADTDTMTFTNKHYLPIHINDHNYGAVGIEVGQSAMEASERGILLSILGEVALALENEKNEREKEEAAILAERERLRANLLRTISHDLRTPLTTIMGNASSLIQSGEKFDVETTRQIYEYIYDDSLWLIKLVENLLYATRIEDGRMMISANPELVTELIAEAMKHLSHQGAEHQLCVECPDEFLMVRADAKLLIQVIINLVDNAVKYTPAGSRITIRGERTGKMVTISVTDTGNGISDEEKPKIFDKFYSGGKRQADVRQGLGLGLFLCKSIVEAHGGSIEVADHIPHGAIFRFSIPAEEVSVYESISNSCSGR